MRRILVPIDGSSRSLTALKQINNSFSPEDFEIILVMVYDALEYLMTVDEEDSAMKELNEKLEMVEKKVLSEFKVVKKALIGTPGRKIIECAGAMNVDLILITKSTDENKAEYIGSTASYIIRYANCAVLVAKEKGYAEEYKYRGLVYRKAEATVTLRGQLSGKKSECLLPSVSGDCIYTIRGIRGEVKFIHRSFNKATMRWDIPPENGQEEIYTIKEGQELEIPVNVANSTKKADRLRVVNFDMDEEAVFYYSIRLA